MEKYLIFLIIIIIVIYCLFCNQIDTKDTFTTVSPSVIGIDDTNSIATLGDLARDYLETSENSDSILILGNVNIKNKHVLVSDNDNWLRLKSKTDLSQNSNLAVKDFDVDGSFNLLPSGMIFAWYGGVVPTGWIVCDGSNGTPDLRGRFILSQGQGGRQGSGQASAPYLTNRLIGDYGGRNEIKLSTAEMPNHLHTYSQPHDTVDGRRWNDCCNSDNPGEKPTYKGTVSTPSTGINDSNGQNLPFNNMPPYCVLLYIMKL
jgi:microcystin-dependent protein